jgi:dihydropteroate synthase
MEPVLRICGHGVLNVTLQGLNPEQASFLKNILKSFRNGAQEAGAPSFFSDGLSKSLEPAYIISGSPYYLGKISHALCMNESSRDLGEKIVSLLDNYLRPDYKIKCRGKFLDLGGRTLIMGILNATPDSFSDGGLHADPARALDHAREMVASGADILDVGGESTRPGSLPVSEEEELRRIIPLIERLSAELSVPISVDTYKSSVAKRALLAGASIVNDISGLRFSPDMAKVVAGAGAAVVIMHIKGTPRDMQQNPEYEDIVGEILSYMEESIRIAESAGIDREQILIDPGIGFGKTLEHNLTILNRLEELRVLGRPIVLGTSRKKFIGAVLDVAAPDQRVDGTAATVALGIERGASVVRVHDVRRMSQVARMTDAIVRASTNR